MVAIGVVISHISNPYPVKEKMMIGTNIRHVVSRKVPTISIVLPVEEFGWDDFLSALMYSSNIPHRKEYFNMPRKNRTQKHQPYQPQSNPQPKTRFRTKREAEAVAERQMLIKPGLELFVYQDIDGGWYLTRKETFHP